MVKENFIVFFWWNKQIKAAIPCQLSVLQKEMNRMKKENTLLRKVVEQTMKDYYELQVKLAAIQQSSQQMVWFISIFKSSFWINLRVNSIGLIIK